MGLKDFFRNLASSPAELPVFFRIPNENIDIGADLKGQFEPNQHYFTVKVNEMFLSERRRWFREIEPMVVCLSSYIYGEQEIDNPFIVGRNLIKNKVQNIPEGMLFSDTRVAGIHPYSGGRVVVSMVLCESLTQNHLSNSLDFIEKVASVFSENIASLVSSYLKIANVVLGAIDTLLDTKSLKPILGFRQEFDRDANDQFAPGYHVIIDKSTKNWNPKHFFVIGNRLYYGSSQNVAKVFREDEYVMFSLTRSETRSDIRLLPVWQSYQKILNELKVTEVSADHKERIKKMLTVLSIEMRQSPDLTQAHAKKLILDFADEVKSLIKPKFNLGANHTNTESEEFWDMINSKIAAI
ncbi:hypothetical protein [Dyadobacter arcticus]|uniref:Uncharacterized protein n=1 Tax=Dyadobacter arcticus TaxID=1078754 RepID=A0ABX0URJ1_9BACT|nr:hypothetical protein [Dyadobacter arcticus]NIJ55437.1 hypothetical protein [Dyadobacter arcticus]